MLCVCMEMSEWAGCRGFFWSSSFSLRLFRSFRWKWGSVQQPGMQLVHKWPRSRGVWCYSVDCMCLCGYMPWSPVTLPSWWMDYSYCVSLEREKWAWREAGICESHMSSCSDRGQLVIVFGKAVDVFSIFCHTRLLCVLFIVFDHVLPVTQNHFAAHSLTSNLIQPLSLFTFFFCRI